MESHSTNQSIRIDQAIHGYSDGHQLLASSVRLPRDVDRLMLVLSDLSGSTGGEEFDAYLTGYPVTSAGFYAFARTWPALEMRRPGCVWTHTLLVRNEDVQHLSGLDLLLDQFRRPNRDAGLSEYREALSISLRDDRAGQHDRDLGPSFSDVLRSLYGNLNATSIVVVPNYHVAEMPLVAIWSGQWANLRQRFTFCTGTRGMRSIEGKPFALQATFEKDLRRVDRSPPQEAVIRWGESTDRPIDAWIHEIENWIQGHESNGLPEFVASVGEQLPGEISLMRPIVESFQIMRNEGNVARALVGYIAHVFPGAHDALEFKHAILRRYLSDGLPDSTLITELLAPDTRVAFSEIDLGLEKRSRRHWRNPGGAAKLLVSLMRDCEGSFADQLLQGLIQSIPESALGEIAHLDVDALARIFEQRPSLTTSQKIWRQTLDAQQLITTALARCDHTALNVRKVIKSALQSQRQPAEPQLAVCTQS